MKLFESDKIGASIRRHMKRRGLRGLAVYRRLMAAWASNRQPSSRAWRESGFRMLREAVIGRRIGDLRYARFCVNQARAHRELERNATTQHRH